jgi:DNA invertase Pin-like site-specific DNA recombinase
MGAVLYIRVSTAEQAKQQYNLPVQENKNRDFCQQQNLRVLRLFTDRGESARSTDRTEFQKMLAYCRENRGKVSHVVVADLSRLARNVVDQGTTIAMLQQLGITLVSVDEPITDDTAAGKLARNMLGAMNQFFSDSLSERVRFRMKAGLDAGRFLHYAPIGYNNVEKDLVVDPQRAPLIRHAFELIASGNYSTTDSVLSLVTAMGLRTRKGRPVTKQSWGRLLSNVIYCGWIKSGENQVRGKHEPLISEETFQKIQDRINGKSRPHAKLNEDFPLRGFVKCSGCGKNLTGGWAKGRKERYARYWCWQKGCGEVGVSRDELEADFIAVLSLMQPTADFLAQLPLIAAREWEIRKVRIGKDAERLSKRLADQDTLNRKAIEAKINGDISVADFKVMKDSISAESERIKEQISAVDSERSAMQDLIAQAQVQVIDLVAAWKGANVNQKQEMAKGLFDGSLLYSPEKKFFEPRNTVIRDMQNEMDSGFCQRENGEI